MKTLILALLLSSQCFGAITVISDLDDTIKITDAGDHANAAWNGIFTEKVFSGMPEFLRATRSFADSLHVVSAGPKLIKGRVLSLLKKHNIKHEGVYLRKIPGKEGKLEFKVRTILEIMEKNPGEVLLLGDDVDLDPEIYTEIVKQHPERVLGVYIHMVKNRPIPESFTPYWTSMDLALKEHMAGRLDSNSVIEIINALMSEAKLTRIIPKFANCPTSAVVWQWQHSTVFMKEAMELSNKLNEFCLRLGDKHP